MEMGKICKYLEDKFKDEYCIYKNSFHIKENKIFFLIKYRNKKCFCEINYNNGFLMDKPVKNVFVDELEGRIFYLGIFETSVTNSKKLFDFMGGPEPSRINKRISIGFGDRIGIAAAAHVKVAGEYDFFPVFAQQSVREIIKTGKDCETVLHNAFMGIFQEGYRGSWGTDADHIRDLDWVKIMAGNKYMPYTMFTIDTYDYVYGGDKSNNKDVIENAEFKERFKKGKKYIGKRLGFNNYNFTYDEDNLFEIIKKYYRCLNFLKECFLTIRQSNKKFDFEPTFDERDIDTKPEDHFYIVSELLDDGIDFSTLALKFPGIFEKGIDYKGNLTDFIEEAKIHKKIVDHFNCYKISLHSADDKFKIFGPFREIFEGKFHIKTSGTTWMESLRTIAECKSLLFKKIFESTLNDVEKNSADYYINLDFKKINNLFGSTSLKDLIDIKETRQLLHVSYGTIINKFKDEIKDILLANERLYYDNILRNYSNHLNMIFNDI